MANTLKLRGGTTAEVAAATLAEREIMVDTTKDVIVVGPSKNEMAVGNGGTYTGSYTFSGPVTLSGGVTFGTSANANSLRIQNVATPLGNSDAVNKSYVDTEIANLSTTSVPGHIFSADSSISITDNNPGAGDVDLALANDSVTTDKIVNGAVTAAKLDSAVLTDHAAQVTACANYAAAAATSAAAAHTHFDNFDDTYLGAKAADPTTDNDGDPLTGGDLYFNTTDNLMRVYDGTQWKICYVESDASLIISTASGNLTSTNVQDALNELQTDIDTRVVQTSGTGSANLPVGTTQERDASPSAGMLRYNSTNGEFEGYTTTWGPISGVSQTYIDNADATKVSKSGDTMSGNLDLGGYDITNVDGIAASTINASSNVSIDGDLTVNGLVSTLGSTQVKVRDKNIDLSVVPQYTFSADSTSGSSQLTVASGVADNLVINALITGTGIPVGTRITGKSSTIVYLSANSSHTGTISATQTGASDQYSSGGGFILKGTTDHTFLWYTSNYSWHSSDHIDLDLGKNYKINGATVLSNNALGSGVVNSNLASVGTITSGTWQATPITATRGGTNLSTAPSADGQLLIGDSNGGYTLSTLTAGSNVTITNTAGGIEIASTGGSGGTNYIIGDGLDEPTTGTLTVDNTVARTNASNLFQADQEIGNGYELRFPENMLNGSNYIGFQAPANLSSSATYTLPSTALSSLTTGVLTAIGPALAWQSPSSTTKSYRQITTSTSAPSGGDDGDIWIQYTP